MIIWSGKGILALPVVGLMYGLLALLGVDDDNLAFALVPFLSAGIFCLLMRKNWNAQDTLFFIPMKYWSILFPLIGAFFALAIIYKF